MNKVYLGDSVYAENDGFGLILTTENGYRSTNRIVLEPVVWNALLNYMNACTKKTLEQSDIDETQP